MIFKALRGPYNRTMLVLAACLAIIAGLASARFFALHGGRWMWACIPVVALSVWRRNFAALLGVVLLCLSIGMWRGSVFAQRLAIYDALAGQKVTIAGTATSDAVYGKNAQLAFTMDHAVATTFGNAPLTGSMSIAGFGASAIYRGDRMLVTGKLYKTRGNNAAGISYAVLKVQSRHTSSLDVVRRKFAAGMQSALPEPIASFGMGLLVGQRNTLPPDISQMLLAVGLTHIIAVSGYNLTIILRVAGKMLGSRSKFQYMFWSCCLIFVFLALAGLSPSIVRASVVSSLGLATWYYGRKIRPFLLLMLSAAITAIANPVYVWGNVSWYLSFLAFFGVLVVAPLATKRIYKEREPRLITSIIIESLCAEIMTLPYVLYIFGQMSMVAIPSNVLVVALVPLAMLLSLVAGVCGMVVSPLAGWFAWPAKLLMTYMLDAANVLSKIPHSFVEGIGFSLPMMLFCYFLVLGVMGILWHHNHQTEVEVRKMRLL